MLVLWVVTCFRQYIETKLKSVVPKEQGNEMFDIYMNESFVLEESLREIKVEYCETWIYIWMYMNGIELNQIEPNKTAGIWIYQDN